MVFDVTLLCIRIELYSIVNISVSLLLSIRESITLLVVECVVLGIEKVSPAAAVLAVAKELVTLDDCDGDTEVLVVENTFLNCGNKGGEQPF